MLTDQSIQLDYGRLNKSEYKIFDKRLSRKLIILNKYLAHFQEDTNLKIKIEHTQHGQATVVLRLLLRKVIVAKATAKLAVQALEQAFDALKENLLQMMDQVKQHHEYSPRSKRSQLLNSAYEKLVPIVIKQDKNTFGKELLPLLNDLASYIKRRLRFAKYIGIKELTDFKSPEIVNQVVLAAFNQFMKKPRDFSLEHWLFQLADKQLDKILKEAIFESKHLRDWDKFVQKAIDDMDEQMSMSAEGSVELVENLDDLDRPLTENFLPTLEYQTDYEQNLSNKEQLAKIVKLLAKLPVENRSIFDLNTVEEFSIDEIAKIKNMKKAEVEDIISKIRKMLREKLKIIH